MQRHIPASLHDHLPCSSGEKVEEIVDDGWQWKTDGEELLQLVMISKYCKLYVNIFWEMGYIKVFVWWQQQQPGKSQ